MIQTPNADALLACRYVISRVRHAAGTRWLQGRRAPPIETTVDDPAVEIVSRHRLRGVGEAPCRALVHWANGERPVRLLFSAPTPRELLAMQARGVRCVSLLGELEATARDDAGLEFAVHDLCHLEKFVDEEHHLGQLGFFRLVDSALETKAFRALDARLDDVFRRDFDAVVADMNGSAIFLFAALKMRLQMASRRRFAREHGVDAKTSGVLEGGELRAYHEDLDDLSDALALSGPLRDAARAISTKRDAREFSRRLLAHFEAVGAEGGGLDPQVPVPGSPDSLSKRARSPTDSPSVL